MLVGDTPMKPAVSCNEVVRQKNNAVSGIYYVMLPPSLRPSVVLCNFEIFGNGQGIIYYLYYFCIIVLNFIFSCHNDCKIQHWCYRKCVSYFIINYKILFINLI